MASSTVMPASSSATSRNPDPPRRPSSSSDHNNTPNNSSQSLNHSLDNKMRTVEDVWKGIMAGEGQRKVCKVEVPDNMMTLEDFLVRAGAVDKEDVAQDVAEDVKVRVPLSGSMSAGVGMMSSRLFSFDSVPLSPFPSLGGSAYVSGLLGSGDIGVGGCNDGGGIGRGKRSGSGVFDNLDRAAQKRQRRMIKNRESAARSRERKQEHQVKLEALALKLEEENEQLLKEKEAQTKERLKLLMEKVIPVVEQRKPPRPLRRVKSWQW